jgi:Phosphodiesterase/alkaline phosphatase D
MPIGLSARSHRARRRPAGAARARDRRSAVVHEARRHPQHGVADRRHALHGRASLRSEPRAYQDFEPFWEFVSGPLHAGTWAPAPLDNTFGRKRCSRRAAARAGRKSRPCFGLQFFGRVDIDGKTEVMTVTLKDVDNRDLWSVDIEPRRTRGRVRSWRSISDAFASEDHRLSPSMFAPHNSPRLRAFRTRGVKTASGSCVLFLEGGAAVAHTSPVPPDRSAPCLSPRASA